MTTQNGILLACVAVFTLVALVSDLRWRRIPNALNVASLALAFVYHVWARGLDGIGFALGGFALGFGLLFVLWLIGGSGAGDVKLMAALGAWLGFTWTFFVVVISTAIVAIGSVLFLSFEWALRGWRATERRYLRGFDDQSAPAKGEKRDAAIAKWRDRRRIMPYALPVGLATWALLMWKLIVPTL